MHTPSHSARLRALNFAKVISVPSSLIKLFCSSSVVVLIFVEEEAVVEEEGSLLRRQSSTAKFANRSKIKSDLSEVRRTLALMRSPLATCNNAAPSCPPVVYSVDHALQSNPPLLMTGPIWKRSTHIRRRRRQWRRWKEGLQKVEEEEQVSKRERYFCIAAAVPADDGKFCYYTGQVHNFRDDEKSCQK